MHVAINGWFWNQPFTGSGQYTRRLLHALHQIDPGLQLTLILPAFAQQADDLPDQVNLAFAPTRFKGHPGKVWFEQRGFPAAAARVGADLAHVPYWGPPLRSPAPLVVTVHDVIPLAMPVYQGGPTARLYTSLVTAAARGATHILTDSHASAAEIVDRIAVPEERVTVAWLAADDRYHPKVGAERDEDVRAKYGLPEQFVLYMNSYDIRKNVHTLLLAYTYVGQAVGEQIPLVLAGKQPREWGTARFADYPAYIKELDLEDWVQWIGLVDEADKPALYRMAEVFVFPSRYEGFGLPVLEAMACGTPVVACDASCIPEIVGDAAFLIGPDDARAMGGAILSLINQPPLAQQMRNLGLGRASQFSWQQTARQTLAVYHDVYEAARK